LGRLADGTASSTCTVSGATKCATFYDTTLNITILNNWNFGTGKWSATAAPDSIQALAESAGFAATGLTGWVLPTGNGFEPAGALNQYLSIYNDAGGSLAGLNSHFDQVQPNSTYVSSDEYPIAGLVWYIRPSDALQGGTNKADLSFGLAVRPGDVLTAAVPEPETYALMLAGLAVVGAAARRRKAP
jgi:hypothetical protein